MHRRSLPLCQVKGLQLEFRLHETHLHPLISFPSAAIPLTVRLGTGSVLWSPLEHQQHNKGMNSKS